MRRRHPHALALSTFGLLFTLACAGPDARPRTSVDSIEPVVEPSPTPPTPPAPQTPPPSDPTAAVTPPAPAAPPAAPVVDVPPEPPILALTADVRVREERRLRVRDEVVDVRFPIVELPDEAARADLDARMRARVASAASASLGYSHGRCRATLATAELVSVMCDLVTPADDRGAPGRPDPKAITFRLTPRGPQRVNPASAFVDGTDLDEAVCAKILRRVPDTGDSCYLIEVSLARDHLVGRWKSLGERGRVRSADVPYTELASLIRRDGILAFAAGDPPATPSHILQAATPEAEPRQCTTYGEPRGPVAIAQTILARGLDRISIGGLDAGHGLFRVYTISTRDVTPSQVTLLADAFGPRAEATCGPPQRLFQRRLRVEAATPVFDLPGGTETTQLQPTTAFVAFDGVVEGRDSMYGRHPGTWAYVVTDTGARGWISSDNIRW